MSIKHNFARESKTIFMGDFEILYTDIICISNIALNFTQIGMQIKL